MGKWIGSIIAMVVATLIAGYLTGFFNNDSPNVDKKPQTKENFNIDILVEPPTLTDRSYRDVDAKKNDIFKRRIQIFVTNKTTPVKDVSARLKIVKNSDGYFEKSDSKIINGFTDSNGVFEAVWYCQNKCSDSSGCISWFDSTEKVYIETSLIKDNNLSKNDSIVFYYAQYKPSQKF